MNFEIIRCKAPHNERNVTVRQGRNTWQIDPQALIQAATGVTISRAYCIVSFADGLAEESGQVMMTKGQGWGWQAGTEYHHRRSSFILVYYLLGRAWATNQWDNLVASLKTYVQPRHRLRVLEETAEYFYYRRYERITLRLPSACSA